MVAVRNSVKRLAGFTCRVAGLSGQKSLLMVPWMNATMSGDFSKLHYD